MSSRVEMTAVESVSVHLAGHGAGDSPIVLALWGSQGDTPHLFVLPHPLAQEVANRLESPLCGYHREAEPLSA